jgi:hypothetical protein
MSTDTSQFDLSTRLSPRRLKLFADYLLDLSARAGFKISSRGWAYYLESERLINKDQFDKVEDAINRCRRQGLIPIDFVAEESSRQFHGVQIPSYRNGTTMDDVLKRNLEDVLDGSHFYTPDWWDGEEFYIQCVVEKVDLKTLFTPVCDRFKVPIATSKGWSSMLQRAEYARRYAEAEADGLKCVLLYCGDHDPDGLRISEFLRTNLEDLKDVVWSDGLRGFDPSNLIIDRFGLNKTLIDKHRLTWIDNLITGSGKNLASKMHKNNGMPYVQEYLRTIGMRKCEANAIIPHPGIARALMTEAIEKYLGPGAPERFALKREAADQDYKRSLKNCGLDPDVIVEAIENI